MPALKTYREAIFSGWFGPMGVGAVFLAMVAKEEMEEIYHEAEEPPVTIALIKPVVLFIVLSSTLVHGTTIPLFKIGNRIRTRTLSIASTGSGQVLRLPKLPFGQNNKRKDSAEERGPQDEHALQLKRNTLLNTNQPHQQQPNNKHDLEEDEYDGLNEEDFLPDESDETQVDQESEKVGPLRHAAAVPAAATTESQSIRFLEPVNPRAGSAGQLNSDRNEASVSSFRSWKNRNKEGGTPTDDVGIVASSPTPHHVAAAGAGAGGGLRNLFRRNNNKEDIHQEEEGRVGIENPTVQVTAAEEGGDHHATMEHLKHMFPHHNDHRAPDQVIHLGHQQFSSRIEVWDEPNHVVIEDKRDASSNSVIDKADPNWKELVKERIKQLEENIEDEVDIKQQHAM